LHTGRRAAGNITETTSVGVEISAFAPICGKPCEQQNPADVIART
jgi:hypothetical protein